MTDQEQESKWREEAQRFIESEKAIHAPLDLHMVTLAYLAACKARQGGIERLERRYENIDEYAKDVCIIYERKIAIQGEELEKRDKLLEQARSLISTTTREHGDTHNEDCIYFDYEENDSRDICVCDCGNYKLVIGPCEQWLKEYGELKK